MIPLEAVFPSSLEKGNIMDSSNVEYDLKSIDDCEWITESCKKDREWWQEALNFAAHAERTKYEQVGQCFSVCYIHM